MLAIWPRRARPLLLACLLVPAPAAAADFSVDAIKATVTGARVTYDVTICNLTPLSSSPPVAVHLYLDAKKKPECGSGGEDATASAPITWGRCEVFTTTLTLPAGRYRTWALANGDCKLPEDDLSNNAKATTVVVRPGEADLYVRRLTATPRDTETRFSAEVCSGPVPARQFSLRLWPSRDGAVDCASRGAWGSLKGTLAASSCTTVEATVRHLKPGVRTAWILADAACEVPEKDESNNAASVTYTNGAPPADVLDWVDPFIGTGADGETFPGPSAPFGMIQPGPDTRIDAPSGYKNGDKTILGFSHTRMSGVGRTEMRDFLLMPATGAPVPFTPGTATAPGYRARHRKDVEQAEPGYYRVLLENGIAVELTAGKRTAIHRYTFPATSQAQVLVDLLHPKDDPIVTAARLTVTSDREITGYRRTTGWAPDRRLYFYARFSLPLVSYDLALDDAVTSRGSAATATFPVAVSGKNVKARLSFGPAAAGTKLLVTVGISGVSEAQAKKNALAEAPASNFDRLRAATAAAWRAALGRIRVTGGTPEERRQFFTALYHVLLGPLLFMDVDGKYLGADGAVHTASGFVNYTAFSLWDTFRTVHPLFNLIEPARTVDFVKSLLARYDEVKTLPRWPIQGNFTFEMIGNHAIAMIADTYVKGVRGFDAAKAFAAMKATVERSDPKLAAYRTRGWVTYDVDPEESVSRTLEYAYDDWAIAAMAAKLGYAADVTKYATRALAYEKVYDAATGFMRPRYADGTWVTPFDTERWLPPNGFTEADAWQYLWFVPHDIHGLITLLGGKKTFESRLDAFFSESAPLHGVYGVYGRNNIGNQPAHHTPYLYVYVGEPAKTQALVRHILRDLFSDRAGGLPGNDDFGDMSSWYLFSAMGFYPVTPGSDVYILGSPLFRRVEIDLGKGKRFVLSAPKASANNVFIQGATLNGKRLTRAYLRHAEVAAGGTLVLEMGPAPSATFGMAPADLPP